MEEGVVVNLTGTATDTDGNIVTSNWQQVSGVAVTISGGNSANASFTAPLVSSTQVLEFRFKVTDNSSAMGSDTLTVTVSDVPPFSTANLSALIASADSRLISDFAALESEQSTAQVQAQAGGTYLSGAYLSSTRSRVVNYADSFFIFVSDEAIRLTNDGTLFSRTDLIALLDSYRNDWQLYLDQFLPAVCSMDIPLIVWTLLKQKS